MKRPVFRASVSVQGGMVSVVWVAASTLLLLPLIVRSNAGCLDAHKVRNAKLVFRGLATDVSNGFALFSILDMYKGENRLGTKRRQSVLFKPTDECSNNVTMRRQYIVATKGSMSDVTPWSTEKESQIWTYLGWHPWSQWSPCSEICNVGKQERHRSCSAHSCPGPTMERRHCNFFPCEGAVSLLDKTRYFHPSRRTWERVPDRHTAWRLRDSSYIWVPTSKLFHGGSFPVKFSLLVTLRLKSTSSGNILSVRCRRRPETYLSLEVAGKHGVKLVHSGANGTESVNISAPLADGSWHQFAIALDDSTVKSYLDCQWISTNVLKKNSLKIHDDADIVIGYLFKGDLEQLTLVPSLSAAAQQCSVNKTSEPPNLYIYRDSWERPVSSIEDSRRPQSDYYAGMSHEFSCRFQCLNGGKCVGVNQCECPRNATGPTCAQPVCEPSCEHGSTCATGNRCVCAPGTTGTRCEHRYNMFSSHTRYKSS